MNKIPPASDGPPATEPDGSAARCFCIRVWPAVSGRRWHAALGAAGIASPRRFARPTELVLYLTELGGDAAVPDGLR